jgi:hypothetical protein
MKTFASWPSLVLVQRSRRFKASEFSCSLFLGMVSMEDQAARCIQARVRGFQCRDKQRRGIVSNSGSAKVQGGADVLTVFH